MSKLANNEIFRIFTYFSHLIWGDHVRNYHILYLDLILDISFQIFRVKFAGTRESKFGVNPQGDGVSRYKLEIDR